jgi:hypothetical protein
MSIHWGGRGAGHISRWSASTTGVPALSLDFLSGTLDPRITFTRSSTATFTGSNGLIQSAAVNEPRFDYNPSTLAPKGLLIEEARTNLLLNSLINGASLSTQTVTVAATPYTISFYGTGTITLSGASVAIVTGTGVYPNRQTLTFTPSAGALICTVSGSVQYAQLEAGSFATSFIPTAGTSVIRNNDVASMTGTNFSSWFNQSEGTFLAEFSGQGTSGTYVFAAKDSGSFYISTSFFTAPTIRSIANSAGGFNFISTTGGAVGTVNKTAFGYKTNDLAASTNGANPATTGTAVLPTVDRLAIGSFGTFSFINGHIRQIVYYNTRLLNTQLRTLSQ